MTVLRQIGLEPGRWTVGNTEQAQGSRLDQAQGSGFRVKGATLESRTGCLCLFFMKLADFGAITQPL